MSASTRRHPKVPLLFVAAVGLGSLGDDCSPDIVQDATFRDWCGSSLCAWKLDIGKVAPMPTWNEDDKGVGFVDTPTQISQATDESSATCITFTTVADIDPSADVTLRVDFNSDGTFEYENQLGSTQWESVTDEITAPRAYQGITFVLRKSGTGTAILAEMRVQSTSGCTSKPVAITPGSLILGEKCGSDDDCAPGLTCTGAASDLLCSQCSGTVSCPGMEGCKSRSVFLPAQCDPGGSRGKAGAPCLAGSDCTSGSCEGATPVPLTPDAGKCDLEGTLGAGDPKNCEDYGARGGTCR